MGGNFGKINSGGTYVAYDSDEQRAGRVAYGPSDDPQIVGRGLVETDGAGGIFQVDGARNIRSVTVVGTDVVIELDEDQTAARYPVILTPRRSPPIGPADIALDYQFADLRRVFISARQISTGVQIDMSATVVSFAFIYLRA